MDEKNKTVFVTGFGPFGDHKVNDSWQAVNQLHNSNLESKLGIVLRSTQIQVIYKSAATTVQDIWKNHNPDLVIHVGVHNQDSVMLEKQARKSGYCQEDVSGCVIENNTCPIDGGDLLSTEIDLDDLIEKVKRDDIKIQQSTNAGNYLCEFTYYMSLCHNKARALFVHIPPSTSLVPLKTKVEVLEDIIRTLCAQLQ
ncbi:pyroglutamyl-peptidase 1 [Cimex lectularius]|uniref:Pyroglutamyl-peptidase I n=1 Tax=Cimex lectularius TaxID=79782 RepID=A0A8I6RB99_CIMLE|nr:pyroglutamyl-peptidase 1 [Cimex lectularius]XP_014242002.1 pyroglutamyl-peptidase 1 [Cimex lectularius]XP_014242003.1 pyroglutamyl-peptidase 1 [Cimex lectularius]